MLNKNLMKIVKIISEHFIRTLLSVCIIII